ncbi:hypothetical protein PtB15_3B71 [Puccinia triticina]|nr:hypothetical protein PtB15_3B71 [Puccinia triticina]
MLPLPIELALYILLKLAQHNDPRHLLSARAVSKSWQRLAEDSLIWKQSFLSQPTYHQPPIPRRLSQLIGLAQPTPHWIPTSEAAPQLNWLKLFRDRYIIDRRWRHGSQLSKKIKGHKDLLIRTFDGHLRGLACLKLVEHHRQIITGSNDKTIKI